MQPHYDHTTIELEHLEHPNTMNNFSNYSKQLAIQKSLQYAKRQR